MKRSLKFLVWTASILHSNSVTSQYYYYNEKYYNTNWTIELGGTAGMMNSLTDIGGRKGTGKKFIKDLNWKMTKPSFGIYATAMYLDVLGIRLEGTFGSIRSYDSILKSVGPSTFGRYERNLSFKTNITEIHFAAEFHPFFLKTYEEGDAPLLSPYIIAGIGLFNFNPQAYLDGKWHHLHPLRTEGQGFSEYTDRKQYKLTQVNLPVGIGARYEVGPFVSARLEFLYRVLFTDYIDDASQVDYIDPALFINYLSPAQTSIATRLHDRRISTTKNNQRGNPKDNDAYFSIQLKVGITLRSARTKQ
jgi:hypothetical protein